MWAAIVEKLEGLEQDSQALDVGQDAFDDDDDEPYDPTEFMTKTTTSFDLPQRPPSSRAMGPLPVWTRRSYSHAKRGASPLRLPARPLRVRVS